MKGLGFMLGLNNVAIEVKKVRYPFYFDHRNVCIHCGKEQTLVFVDRFGRECTNELEAFEHIKCKACGRLYSIEWNMDYASGKMRPTAVEFSLVNQFNNLLNRSVVKHGDRALD